MSQIEISRAKHAKHWWFNIHELECDLPRQEVFKLGIYILRSSENTIQPYHYCIRQLVELHNRVGSNFVPNSRCPGFVSLPGDGIYRRRILVVSSIPPGKCLSNTTNWDTTVSFNILANSLFTNLPAIRYHRDIIITFTRTRHWSMSWYKWIHPPILFL